MGRERPGPWATAVSVLACALFSFADHGPSHDVLETLTPTLQVIEPDVNSSYLEGPGGYDGPGGSGLGYEHIVVREPSFFFIVPRSSTGAEAMLPNGILLKLTLDSTWTMEPNGTVLCDVRTSETETFYGRSVGGSASCEPMALLDDSYLTIAATEWGRYRVDYKLTLVGHYTIEIDFDLEGWGPTGSGNAPKGALPLKGSPFASARLFFPPRSRAGHRSGR